MRVIALLSGLVALSLVMTAQTSVLRLTATTENVSGAGEAIRINLTNWSTDADRDQMVAAWTLTASAAATPGAAAARGGRGGARGARGGRGGDGAAALPVDPDADDADSPASQFGRGGARGRGADASAASATPQASLAAALKKEPTVGIFWTSEIVGYSIKYAHRLPQADGGERIILATDRRVGAWSNLWKLPESAKATDYAFSLIELRVNSKGEGEGKISMTGTVVVDSNAKAIALAGYDPLPVMLKGVKRY
jgi:hypothetical protein